MSETSLNLDAVHAALATVNDPEIGKPLTELGMIEAVEATPEGHVTVKVLLTVAGCPLKDRITREVTAAVGAVPGVSGVLVELAVMSEQQRSQLQTQLRGGKPGERAPRVIPFNAPDSLTRVFAVTSGKGGVGKSSVTVNLAAAMATEGLSVGVLDADIYGFSIPRMLGVTDSPTKVEGMIMPPTAHGLRVMSMGMLVPEGTPVVWRGPMLHRALEQFLADVYWSDLDVLLVDLPPGTGDVAISTAQLLPNAELLIVTTPQTAAAEVAQRAGTLAHQTKQRVAGVIENMSYLPCPHCPPEAGHRLEVFGSGGGAAVAAGLSEQLATPVELLGQIPLEPALREGGDAGLPIVLSQPEDPAAQALRALAQTLSHRRISLVGRSLNLTVA